MRVGRRGAGGGGEGGAYIKKDTVYIENAIKRGILNTTIAFPPEGGEEGTN